MSVTVKKPLEAAALENQAYDLGQRLPALLTEAARVAMSVMQGVHGRRRAGPGETFWQFRSFDASDSAAQIDWRRSASSSHLYVREREWEAAHTVWFWPDLSPSMHFQSHLAHYSKAERAAVIAMALALLLTKAGERTGLAGQSQPAGSRMVAHKFAAFMLANPENFQDFPQHARLGKHSEVIIVSDFLTAPDKLLTLIAKLSGQNIRGHLVHILDPAEETMPYSGRVEFSGMDGGLRFMAERAESLKDAYKKRLALHKAQIADAARRQAWSYFIHHTDHPASELLLAMHMRLSGLDKGFKARGSFGEIAAPRPARAGMQ
jgi:uncharacterized protein (DUF58 family)